jgi:predicted lysophospholipase L1 biosynthesis ABC-type transport system permease subunit
MVLDLDSVASPLPQTEEGLEFSGTPSIAIPMLDLLRAAGRIVTAPRHYCRRRRPYAASCRSLGGQHLGFGIEIWIC